MQQSSNSVCSAETKKTSTKTHVYAIIRGEEGLPQNWQAGFEVPLRHVEHQEIAAVVGDCAPSRSAAMTRNVLRHRRVVERLFRYFPIVPLRSGLLFANDWEVSIFLSTHYQSLQWNLERLANRAEYRLHADWFGERIRQRIEKESHAIEKIRSERRSQQPEESRFVSQLESSIMTNEMREIASQLSLTIHAALLSIAAEGMIEVVADSRQMMTGIYLVGRREVEDFRAKARAFEAEQADLRVSISGPLPPYSFAEIGTSLLQASH